MEKIKIGELVERTDRRNSTGEVDNLIGVSIEKCFIKSVANTIGTDLTKYKIVEKDDFAVSLMQVSRDAKIPIARLDEYEVAIMSPAYSIFRIKDRNVILPEYLDMWFKREEFDREAAYIAVGGVRGSMPWEDFANIQVNVPDIDTQKKLIKSYNAVKNRIVLKQKINDNLRAIAETIFFSDIRYVSDSDGKLQDTEIGTFPAEWKVTTLGKVLDCIIDRRGITPTKLDGKWSDDGIIALSAKSVKNHELVNLDIANHVDDDLFERWMPMKLKQQDILMTSEAPLGEFYYLADYTHYCLSQRLFALRANKSIIQPTVLYFQLTDTIGKHQIEIRKTGTTVSGIRQSELVKVPIVLPSDDVQNKFAAICDSIMVQIEKNADEMRKCNKLLSMLLAKLSRH